jgi:hypothetical protein
LCEEILSGKEFWVVFHNLGVFIYEQCVVVNVSSSSFFFSWPRSRRWNCCVGTHCFFMVKRPALFSLLQRTSLLHPFFISTDSCASRSKISSSPCSDISKTRMNLSPARLQSSMLNSAGIISSSQYSSLFPHGEVERWDELAHPRDSPTAVIDVFYSIADILFGSIINTINKHLHSINNSIHNTW